MIRFLCAAGLAAFFLLPALPTAAQADMAARGRYLVESIAGCGNCHNAEGAAGRHWARPGAGG